MKVFIVINNIGEGIENVAAFSSNDNAKIFIENNEDDECRLGIQELEIDAVDKSNCRFLVLMDSRGKQSKVMRDDYRTADDHGKWSVFQREHDIQITFSFIARNKDEARKMAFVKYSEIKNEIKQPTCSNCGIDDCQSDASDGSGYCERWTPIKPPEDKNDYF